MKVTQWNY